MARTKEFDPETALHEALLLFWERGYEATTMSELVSRLGVARASLYATFGDKHALYLAALERYRALTDPLLLAELSRPGPVLPAVRGLVRRYAAEAGGISAAHGCFVVNTAVELAPHDDAAARQVQASWDHLEAVLAAALTRARAQGELSSGSDPVALARCLLVFLQGLRVTGKAATEPARLSDAVETLMSLFENGRS